MNVEPNVPVRREPSDSYRPYELVDTLEDAESSQIDLRAFWAALYRNRWIIAAVVAAALLAGVAITLLTPPTYRATASVQIDQQATKVLGTEDAQPFESGAEADRFLQTQVDVMTSRSLATRVADALGLYGKDAFLAATGQKVLPGEDRGARRDRVLDTLGRNLHVDLPRNSRVVRISFDSRDPRLAADVANSFADSYITANIQRHYDTSAYSRQFLQAQLDRTKTRLEQSERALIGYARSARLIDASAGAPTNGQTEGPKSLTTSNLVQLNQAFSAAQSARLQAQQRWQQAAATPLLSLPEVLSNQAVQQMLQQRAQLQAQFQQLQERLKPGHPQIQQAAAQLKELDSQIATLASGIRASIRGQYETAAKQERAIERSVDQLKGATLSEQDRSVRYNILKREVDTNRQLYDGLLQRFKTLSAEAGVTSNNLSKIDVAEPPRIPVSPRPLVNLALALLGGLAVAAAIAFLRERFDDVVRAPADVYQKLGLPLIGVVPLIKPGEDPIELLDDSRSSLSEAHQALRASLELSSGDGLPSTLLLTSSRKAEGKSTTAIGIARTFALAGRRVVLVDGDLRKPSLHKSLEAPNESGLSSILARQRTIDDVLQATGTDNLSIVTSGPLPPNPAELLGGSSMQAALDELAQRFDLVLIDGPPVLGLADAPRLSSMTGGTLFVVEANNAHFGNSKNALRRLVAAQANISGAILTKFSARHLGYSDYYGYYSYDYQARQQ